MAAGARKTGGYDRLKSYRGGGYSGMKVGGSHKWYYDQGVWKERKVAPDEWNIFYQTTKRRAGKAPDRSGAPVGTRYNWLIVSHQMVDKLDANSYMTCLEGKKFKVAHMRAAKGKWNISEKNQRRQVIGYLQQVIRELERAGDDTDLPYITGERERIYGLDHRTRQELNKLAAGMEISGRSRLSRQELLDAIKARLGGRSTDGAEAGSGAPAARDGQDGGDLGDKTREDLYRIASRRNIPGRSDMKKAELLSALRRDPGADGRRAART